MKELLLGILLIVALGLGGVLLSPTKNALLPAPAAGVEVSYAEEHFSYAYPSSYSLARRTDSFEGNPIVINTLTQSGAPIPDMSEGPQAISIIEVPNPAHLSLEAWVRAKSISNFYLSPDQVLTPMVVGGEPALAYTHTGLYESDAVAVAHGDYVYVLEAGWAQGGDAMRGDFQNLLKTVVFK